MKKILPSSVLTQEDPGVLDGAAICFTPTRCSSLWMI